MHVTHVTFPFIRLSSFRSVCHGLNARTHTHTHYPPSFPVVIVSVVDIYIDGTVNGGIFNGVADKVIKYP